MKSGMIGEPAMSCNPYIGPRPFTRDDARYFKGRDEETAILEGLVLSKRVVLFFAQSGAGKSSLLEAGLIPRLIEERRIGRGARARKYQKMQVLPSLNVGGSFPPGETLPKSNIFVYLALSSLFPDEKRAEIEGYENLSAGLAKAFADREWEQQDDELAGDILLIFDQFEELFTKYAERWQDRAVFFEQVVEALEIYPRLHVLFAMREDYIAELTPYRRLFADDLRTRYRLERLNEANARQAVKEPADICGREYYKDEEKDIDVARDLVKNLGRIQLGAKQAEELVLLESATPLLVEPVHLQIVCQQLWDSLPPEKKVIEADDVQKFGDVDEALKDFYNRNIENVVKGTTVSERHLRRWFSEDLITSNRTRDLFYHDDIASANIPNEVVHLLHEAYIIRRIKRGTDNWYELAHDRMVDPILTANESWIDAYFQQNSLAAAYAASLNDPTLLLRGEQLAKAEQYAAEHPQEVLAEEMAFLEKSIEAKKARKRQRRRRIATWVGLIIFGIAMGVLAWFAYQSKLEADRQKRIADDQREIAETNEKLARSRELAAGAVSSLETDPELGILLGLQALETAYTVEAENALRLAMQTSRVERRFTVDGQAFRGVDISPDGSHLAAAGDDGLVRVWDLQDRDSTAPIRQLPEQVDEEAAQTVYDVTFHPENSKQLATAHHDGSFRVWDIESGELISETIHSENPLFDVVYTDDGSQLISASPLQHGACCAGEDQQFNHAYVFAVAISENGRWLATAGKETTEAVKDNGAVKIWDLESDFSRIPLPVQSLKDNTDGVWAVAFSPDGRWLAAGGEDKKVIVWDITGLEEDPRAASPVARTHFDHTNTIVELRFSANSRCLISAGLDRTAKVWDMETGQLLINLVGHTGQVQGIATINDDAADEQELSPEEICGEQVATVSVDGTVRLWNLGATSEEMTLVEHTEPVESVDFDSAGEQVVTAGDDGRIIIWDTEDGQMLFELIDPALEMERAHGERVNRAVFSPDDEFIATAGWDNLAKLWNLESRDFIPLEGHAGRIESVAFNHDGTLLATASDDGTARIWSVAVGKCLRSVDHNSGGRNTDLRKVYGVRFHPQDEYLVTTGGDGYVRGWKLSEEMLTEGGSCDEPDAWDEQRDMDIEPDELCKSNPTNCTIPDAAFNDEGTQLATVSWNSQVTLRDFPDGNVVSQFEGHTKRLYGVQFSPDEKVLATSAADGTVRIWDLETGQLQRILPGPEFNYLDFSDDGRYLAVAGEDGTARIYALELADLVTLARERLTREKLTEEECERYGLEGTAVCE